MFKRVHYEESAVFLLVSNRVIERILSERPDILGLVVAPNLTQNAPNLSVNVRFLEERFPSMTSGRPLPCQCLLQYRRIVVLSNCALVSIGT